MDKQQQERSLKHPDKSMLVPFNLFVVCSELQNCEMLHSVMSALL